MNTPTVAIIGAGLAGLACATRLQAAGIPSQIFDKSRSPGGRMSTRRGDGWQCDHGAQYFTVTDATFAAAVDQWLAAGVVARWQPRLRAFGAAGWSEPSTAIDRFVGVPRMNTPLRHLADALHIRTDTTVQSIEAGAGGWHLQTAEHGTLEAAFSTVVIAVPAEQAAPLLQAHAPQLAAVAGATQMAPCWSVMLRLATPCALPVDAAFVNAGPLDWIARDSSKPGRNGPDTWLLHATPDWSQAHIDADPEWVTGQLTAAFVALGGSVAEASTAHRWRFARGGTAQPDLCGWDRAARIGMCGDWMAGGRVEGAWRSGNQLGLQLASVLA